MAVFYGTMVAGQSVSSAFTADSGYNGPFSAKAYRTSHPGPSPSLRPSVGDAVSDDAEPAARQGSTNATLPVATSYIAPTSRTFRASSAAAT
jgi:hypothetical protein